MRRMSKFMAWERALFRLGKKALGRRRAARMALASEASGKLRAICRHFE